MIEKYKNYFIFNGLTVPISDTNSDYQNIKEMIANGAKVIDKTLDEAKSQKINETHKPKTYKTKNYLEIKQKRQRQQEREETEQKFYKYGFWILLSAVSVNFILTQI